MDTVYLKDGTKANLVTKTDKGYIVDPYVSFRDYDTKEEYEEPSGDVKLVDKVYESAPKEVIQEEYCQVLAKIEEQQKALQETKQELSKAQYEVSQLQKTKTDLSKLIINRQELKNAKRLVIWIKGRIAPRIMDVKNSLKLTVSYTISQYKTEEQCWAYSCWSDYDDDERWSSYSERLDPEYGIKVDITDDEILSITLDRQIKNSFDSDEISRTSEQWLTPENVEKSKEHHSKTRERRLKEAENELIKIQEKISKLTAEILQPAE